MPPTMTLLHLDPDHTLTFHKGPMPPHRTLTLTNHHTGNVAFKVKTTAPKSYLVRPSAGTLRPRQTTEVNIILQQQDGDGQANSHRFLVQAVAVAKSADVKREQWAEFTKDEIQEQRLNVVVEEHEKADPSSMTVQSKGLFQGQSEMPKGGFEGEADLKTKYDELVRYTLVLEKEKIELEVNLKKAEAAKGGSSSQSGGYTLGHMFIVAVVVAQIAFFATYAGQFWT